MHDLRHAVLTEDPAPPEYVRASTVGRSSLDRRDIGASRTGWRWRRDPLLNHPSAEHYRPLLVVAGAARGETARFPVEGFEHGTISRRSVLFD